MSRNFCALSFPVYVRLCIISALLSKLKMNNVPEMIKMYRFIQSVIDIYSKKQTVPVGRLHTSVTASLDETLSRLRADFGSSADLTIRELNISGIRAAVITIDNMTDKQVLAEGVLMPLMCSSFTGTAGEILDELRLKTFYTPELLEITAYEDIGERIMSGFVVIALDGCSTLLSVGLQGYASRSISEPESDIVQRGSKEGFVEALRVNMTLIRRRLKNPMLRFETMNIGNISNTEIALCYLSDRASPDILARLKKRLSQVPLDTVLTAGYLVPFLEEEKDRSFFTGVGISERPDTVCGKLTEGRIAVLVDGVPSALIVPYIFAEYFQSLDDYSNRAYFATFTRLLKYCAFFISVMLPGLFVALGTFEPEMFPTLMLNKIAASIASTPLSLTAETILILFIYEIMREAGLRMPRPLGYAVSIVGGLVVGDTAVNAGLIGAPTLMVIAISAISSYVVPDLYAPSAILRMLFTIVGGLLGIWGTALLLCVVLVNLCGKSSFGVPYTAPVTPSSPFAFRDVLIRADWKILSKRTETIQDMPGADTKPDAGNNGRSDTR